MQYVYRDGTAIDLSALNGASLSGETPSTAKLTYTGTCPRCCGTGTYGYGPCYRCWGERSAETSVRVYSADRAAALNRAAARRTATATARREARRQAVVAQIPGLAELVALGDRYGQSLSDQIDRGRTLTGRQIDAIAGALDRARERARHARTSTAQGAIGERITRVVTLDYVHDFDTVYGVSSLYRWLDTSGNVYVTLTSADLAVAVGVTVTVTATVTAHETRDGVLQTRIARAKVARATATATATAA